MEKPTRTEISQLFDIYGSLLTDKQRGIFALYYAEDLSITEIAEENGISRAAVHDAIKAAEKALLDYEKKLEILRKKEQLERTLSDVKSKVKSAPAIKTDIEKLEEMVSGI